MTANKFSRYNSHTSTTLRATRWVVAMALVVTLFTACSFGPTETVVKEDSFTVGASSQLNVVSENGNISILASGSSPNLQVTATIKNPDHASPLSI